MDTTREDELILLIRKSPGQTRDFIFATFADDGSVELIHPMSLLALDLASSLLAEIAESQHSKAMVLSLCRLLVPCLEYRGNRRHLIVEEWNTTTGRSAGRV